MPMASTTHWLDSDGSELGVGVAAQRCRSLLLADPPAQRTGTTAWTSDDTRARSNRARKNPMGFGSGPSIGFVSSFPPTVCGIAYYTESLVGVMSDRSPEKLTGVVSLDDGPTDGSASPVVMHHRTGDRASLRDATAFLNRHSVDSARVWHLGEAGWCRGARLHLAALCAVGHDSSHRS